MTGDETTTQGSSLDSASNGVSVLLGSKYEGEIVDGVPAKDGYLINGATKELNL